MALFDASRRLVLQRGSTNTHRLVCFAFRFDKGWEMKGFDLGILVMQSMATPSGDEQRPR